MAFDLGNISLGQVLQIPGVKGIFEKFAPGILNNPAAGLAQNMPLTSVFDIIGKTVGKKESGQVQQGLLDHVTKAAGGAGGIGDLLGGLTGGGKSSGGGIGDIVGGLMGGGKSKSAEDESKGGGIGDIAGGLLGGLMGKKDK